MVSKLSLFLFQLRALTTEDDGYAAFDDNVGGMVGRALAPTAADGGRELENPNASLLSEHDLNFGANASDVPDFGDGDDENEQSMQCPVLGRCVPASAAT